MTQSTELLPIVQEARAALQSMLDAWLDYHDAHSLTDPVTGAAGNAFDKALAARDLIDAALTTTPEPTDPAVGPMTRCPHCHGKFQAVNDVDAYIRSLAPKADPAGVSGLSAGAVYQVGNEGGQMLWKAEVHTPDWRVVATAYGASEGQARERQSAILAALRPSPVLEVAKEALEEAQLQLQYVDSRWPTGTSPAVLSRIAAALTTIKEGAAR